MEKAFGIFGSRVHRATAFQILFLRILCLCTQRRKINVSFNGAINGVNVSHFSVSSSGSKTRVNANWHYLLLPSTTFVQRYSKTRKYFHLLLLRRLLLLLLLCLLWLLLLLLLCLCSYRLNHLRWWLCWRTCCGRIECHRFSFDLLLFHNTID